MSSSLGINLRKLCRNSLRCSNSFRTSIRCISCMPIHSFRFLGCWRSRVEGQPISCPSWRDVWDSCCAIYRRTRHPDDAQHIPLHWSLKVSSKNITLGVPRLKEIINVPTNIKTPLTVYLEPEIAADSALAKNVQQELAHTSLRTVPATVEIWYDPNPTSTISEEAYSSFFAIPDEDVDSKLHLQSPWLLRLELDRAKMIDRKLSMQYVASRIAESFKTDLFVIWSEDNSERLVIRCRVLGSPDRHRRGRFLTTVGEHHAQFCQPSCVKGIKRVFLTQRDSINITEDGNIRVEKGKEWVLETDSVNLRTVMCTDGVDFTRTYSNSCVEIWELKPLARLSWRNYSVLL